MVVSEDTHKRTQVTLVISKVRVFRVFRRSHDVSNLVEVPVRHGFRLLHKE